MRRRRPARFASSLISRGAALDTLPRLLLERLAGGRFGLLPGLLGAVEQAAPGGAERLAVERRPPTQRSACAAQVPARRPRAGSGPARGRRRRGGRRRRPRRPSRLRGERGFDRRRGQRRELDRLAARGDRLQQRLGLGAEQDQVGERRRLLERLQQRVLALVAHRLRRLDHEDPPAALEGPVGGGADHPLAHLLDQVLGAARGEPDEVGVGRGVEQRPAPGVLGVLGGGGEDLGGEGAGGGALAGAARAAEEVGVRGAGRQRRGQRQPRPRLVLGRRPQPTGELQLKLHRSVAGAGHARGERLHHPRVDLLDAAAAVDHDDAVGRRSRRSPRRPRRRRAGAPAPRTRSGPRPRPAPAPPRGRSGAARCRSGPEPVGGGVAEPGIAGPRRARGRRPGRRRSSRRSGRRRRRARPRAPAGSPARTRSARAAQKSSSSASGSSSTRRVGEQTRGSAPPPRSRPARGPAASPGRAPRPAGAPACSCRSRRFPRARRTRAAGQLLAAVAGAGGLAAAPGRRGRGVDRRLGVAVALLGGAVGLLHRLLGGAGGLALLALAAHLDHRRAVVVEAELPGAAAERLDLEPRRDVADRAAVLELPEVVAAPGQGAREAAGVGRVGVVAVPALAAAEPLAAASSR